MMIRGSVEVKVFQVHIAKVSEVFIEELKLKRTRHAVAPDASVGSCVNFIKIHV